MKSVVTSSKIRTVIKFYAKTLKRLPDLTFTGQITFSRNFKNNWNKSVNFRQLLKIILINEDSFLEMYPNNISFLTYWFLRTKWLFAKYMKITIETVIHKNRFSEKPCIEFGNRRSVTKSEFCNDMLRIIFNQYLLWVIMML